MVLGSSTSNSGLVEEDIPGKPFAYDHDLLPMDC